ncbi:putative procollagen-proline 4-dioxygenase [Lupinus albus]|uniref:Putative procollagen-proline 4-dioxygenase n=1 Tax=Lupinus albus TaxID=3870 RepID=A0A6A4PTX8_LUPAL|nr:putative procollagen-proline 4-dioxygenase [Lupinus albus]
MYLIFTVKPMKGDALLFFNIHLNATADTTSLHGSCPVIEGEKWLGTKWIHANNYDMPYKKLRRNPMSKLVNV